MKFGLKEETIDRINNVFAGFSDVQEVIIYGSRAQGTSRPGSDIDLTLKGDGLELERLNKIRGDLDDLLLPYTLDLSIYDKIESPELMEHIKRAGKVFYLRR